MLGGTAGKANVYTPLACSNSILKKPCVRREYQAQVPALSVCNSSVLALFASGRTRGLALEVGGGVAHAVPVFEGFALNHAVLRLEGAGQDITYRLKLLLEARGHHLPVGGTMLEAWEARVLPLETTATVMLVLPYWYLISGAWWHGARY